MEKIKIITLLILVMASISCTDEITGTIDDEISISSFEDYFKFMNQEADGSVLIQSISTINSNGEIFSVSSSIKGNKNPLTFIVDDRTLNFSNYHYSSKQGKSHSNLSNQDLRNVFGNKFEVELNTSSIYAKSTASDKSISSENISSISSVYIPELVSASFSNLANGKIVAGTSINWNADYINQNGVVIGLEYNPLAQPKKSIKEEKPERLLTGLTVEDNGSYTISAKDLSQYPSNAMMTLYIGRAGYNNTTDTSGNNDYSLAAMTVSRADLEIQR